MDKNAILQTLTEWRDTISSIETQYQQLSDLIGAQYDSPFGVSLANLETCYTLSVERGLGILPDPDMSWLAWYRYECKMGEKQQSSTIYGVMFEIQSLDSLADLVIALRARG